MEQAQKKYAEMSQSYKISRDLIKLARNRANDNDITYTTSRHLEKVKNPAFWLSINALDSMHDKKERTAGEAL